MFTAYAATAAENIASGTANKLAGLLELIIARIPLWIAAFIVILLSVLVAKLARNSVENKLAERGIEQEHKEMQILGGRLAYSGVLIIGITIGLKIGGIDLTTIIAAGAFGIGFALKDLIMNFLAGIMILVGRHFTIGDFIQVGSTIGKVTEIQSRVTILQATDGTRVVVPNAELFKKQVVSFTTNPFRRVEVMVGFDYRTNIENALKVCMKVLKGTKGVLIEPKPSVLVTDFGDSSIDVKLRAWVDSRSGWMKVKSDLIRNLNDAFNEYGIDMPWPVMTVAYDKDKKFDEKLMNEEPAKNGAISDKIVTTSVMPLRPAIAAEEAIISEDEQPLRPLGEQR
ncbi:mechanosensitive ion channel family protein [Candidatus Peregrinibacteria bacterium]|nr:mechanosensitive ion channel family protein [Candidatus Peregrinibacteria bacterium]